VCELLTGEGESFASGVSDEGAADFGDGGSEGGAEEEGVDGGEGAEGGGRASTHGGARFLFGGHGEGSLEHRGEWAGNGEAVVSGPTCTFGHANWGTGRDGAIDSTGRGPLR
jgi:hypothetical protein